MTFILCIPVFLIIAIVNPQFVPSSYETAFVEEQEMKECNTICSKKQGKFKVHDKDSGKKQHKDCVNNMVLEKDGEKYCISDKGNDILKCESESKSKGRLKQDKKF